MGTNSHMIVQPIGNGSCHVLPLTIIIKKKKTNKQEKSTQRTKLSLKRKAETLDFENPASHGEPAVPSSSKC